MPSSVKLLCVPPADVQKFWKHVRRFIIEAMFRGGGEYAHVKRSVFDGIDQLWIVWDGAKIVAAAVTSLGIVNDEKTCTIVACGGEDFSCFGHFVKDLEQFAKAEGCRVVRINGRAGWKRALTGYNLQSVVLRKEI
jgi:hypothetical protein